MANCLPFNSIDHDRVYKAEDWAWYFSTFISNGVFPQPSNGLQVIAGSDMDVTVKPGFGFIDGYAFRNTGDYTISLDTADGVLSRIDRVVLRLDLSNRDMVLAVLKGTASKSPVATALTRTADIYELALADIAIGKGVTSITQSVITDRRSDSSLCGICAGTIDQIDITSLTEQFNAQMDEQKLAFAQWVTSVEGLVDDNTSATLLAKAVDHDNRLTALEEGTTNEISYDTPDDYTEPASGISLKTFMGRVTKGLASMIPLNKILSATEWAGTISERGHLADAKDVKESIDAKPTVKIKTTYKEYKVTANVTLTVTPADSGFTSGYNGIYYAFPEIVAATQGFTTPKIFVGASGDSNQNITMWSSVTQSLYVRICYLYY